MLFVRFPLVAHGGSEGMLTHRFLRGLVVLFLILVPGLMAGQHQPMALSPQPYLVQFTTEDGLPSNQVYAIESAASGRLFFATQRGIASFDGQRFTRFSTKNGLAGTVVFGLHLDRKERLWYFTFENRIGYWEAGQWHHHPANRQLSEAMGSKVISSLAVDDSNRVWLGYKSRNTGVVRLGWEGDLSVHYQGALDTLRIAKPLAEAFVWGVGAGTSMLVHNSDGHLFQNRQKIQSESQIALFPHQNEFRFIADERLYQPVGEALELVYSFPSPIHFYCYDSLVGLGWVGTRKDGLFAFKKGRVVQHLLPGCSIYDVHRDHEGGLWISTASKGVFYWAPDAPVYYPFPHSANYQQFFFYEGRMLLAQPNAIEEWVLQDSTWILQSQLHFDGYSSLYLVDDQLLITFDTAFQVLELQPKLQQNGQLVEGMFYSVATWRNRRFLGYFGWYECDERWKPLDDHKHRKGNRIFTLQPEANRLLIGTSQGIWSQTDSSELQLFSSVDSGLSFRVTQIHPVDTGYLLQTLGQGVLWWNGHHGAAQRVEALPTHPFVHRLLPSGKDRFYLLSTEGLAALKRHRNQWQVAPQMVAQGRQSDWRDIGQWKETLWLLRKDGLFTLSPQKKILPTPLPPVELVSLEASGEPLALQTRDLAHHQNDLHFVFKSYTYAHREAVNYQYRINNKPWKPLAHGALRLANLAPNHYHLSVRAYTESGLVSPVKVMAFTIRPPWWRHPLTLVVVLLFLLSLAHLLGSYRQRQRNRILQTKLAHQKAQLQVVQARIHPHFLFNVFNSIQLMVMKGSPQEASRHLSRFARLMREIMRYAGEERITLEQEITFLNLYLELENLRMDPPFSFQIDHAPGMDPSAIALPPLLVQVLIENALWHGLRHLDAPGQLSVYFECTDHRLTCTIVDNGIGRKAAKAIQTRFNAHHQSKGIALVKTQLRLLEAQASKPPGWLSLGLEDNNAEATPTGTRVTLTLPCYEKN